MFLNAKFFVQREELQYAIRACEYHFNCVPAVQHTPAAADAAPDISEQGPCVAERQAVVCFMAEIKWEDIFFFIDIDIRLKKPVEEHETVYAGTVELFNKVKRVRIVNTQFHANCIYNKFL